MFEDFLIVQNNKRGIISSRIRPCFNCIFLNVDTHLIYSKNSQDLFKQSTGIKVIVSFNFMNWYRAKQVFVLLQTSI